MGGKVIQLQAEVWAGMMAHVQACLPEEGCGLLAGRGAVASLAIPVENELHSATRFRMVPAAQIEAMLHIERLDLDLIGIFHSHPDGPAWPSTTDLAEAAYPEAAYLIWCRSPEWGCRGFDLSGSDPAPIELRTLTTGHGQAGV